MRQRPYGLCHDPRTHPFSAESISERCTFLCSCGKSVRILRGVNFRGPRPKAFSVGYKKTGRYPSCFSAIASSARGRPLFKPDARKTGVGPRRGEEYPSHFRELIVGAGRAGRELVVFADAHLGAAVRTTESSSAGFFSRFANVFHDVTSFCHYYAAQTAVLSACPLVKKRKRRPRFPCADRTVAVSRSE